MADKKPTGAAAQVVVPPPPETAMDRTMPNEQEQQFLTSHGWVKDGTNDRGESRWADPEGMKGNRGKLQPAVELPSRDGGDPTVIQQVVCPPANWSYSQQEAMAMQRLRDAAKKKPEPAAA